MKNSIVLFIAVGCFFLSNCQDVGSRYGTRGLTGDRLADDWVLDARLSQIERGLDDCTKRLEAIDSPVFGKLTKVEERVERLRSEEVSLLLTSNLTTHERLEKIEKRLGILQK